MCTSLCRCFVLVGVCVGVLFVLVYRLFSFVSRVLLCVGCCAVRVLLCVLVLFCRCSGFSCLCTVCVCVVFVFE